MYHIILYIDINQINKWYCMYQIIDIALIIPCTLHLDPS